MVGKVCLLLLVILLLCSCQNRTQSNSGGAQSNAQPSPAKMEVKKMEIKSSAFQEGGMIPKQYTCDGQNVSPPLEWSGVPQEARSLVLIADDPDAPDGTFTHWVVFNVPATTKSLSENVARGT